MQRCRACPTAGHSAGPEFYGEIQGRNHPAALQCVSRVDY